MTMITADDVREHLKLTLNEWRSLSRKAQDRLYAKAIKEIKRLRAESL